jgi:hypothetical protein
MEKHELVSTALSCLIVGLLPLHQLLAAELGNPEWVNMFFGLTIGVAIVFNVDIVVNKIRPGKQ